MHEIAEVVDDAFEEVTDIAKFVRKKNPFLDFTDETSKKSNL